MFTNNSKVIPCTASCRLSLSYACVSECCVCVLCIYRPGRRFSTSECVRVRDDCLLEGVLHVEFLRVLYLHLLFSFINDITDFINHSWFNIYAYKSILNSQPAILGLRFNKWTLTLTQPLNGQNTMSSNSTWKKRWWPLLEVLDLKLKWIFWSRSDLDSTKMPLNTVIK